MQWLEGELRKTGDRWDEVFAKQIQIMREYRGDIPLPTKPGVEAGSSLPEGVIRLPDLTIGGKIAKQLEKALVPQRIDVSDYALDLLRGRSFTTTKEQEVVSLVKATPEAMGLKGTSAIEQIFARANELGWDLCKPEVGPYLRLADKDQSLGNWYVIGMNPITDSHGRPSVFVLARLGRALCLRGYWVEPDDRWDPTNEFVFSLP